MLEHGSLQLQVDVVVGIQGQQQLVFQVLDMQAAVRCQRMAWMHDADGLGLMQNACVEFRGANGHGTDHQVKLAVQQSFPKMCGA